MSKYATSFFRYDPFYHAVQQSRFGEVITGHDSWSSQLGRRFYDEHFRPAGNDDELGFGVQLDKETKLVISLVRRQDQGLFGTSDKELMGSILPTVTALVRQQWAHAKARYLFNL